MARYLLQVTDENGGKVEHEYLDALGLLSALIEDLHDNETLLRPRTWTIGSLDWAGDEEEDVEPEPCCKSAAKGFFGHVEGCVNYTAPVRRPVSGNPEPGATSSTTGREIKCAHCGETRKTWSLWRGFDIVPDAEVLCCLIPADWDKS